MLLPVALRPLKPFASVAPTRTLVMNQFGAALVSPSKKRRSDVAATSGDPSVLRHEADREVPFKGMVLKKHSFKVPLDYDDPSKGSLGLLVREVRSSSNERSDLPYLIYLQGGPGFEAPRNTESSGWLKAALAHFRVLLLDQRGTGGSAPVTSGTLSRLPGPAHAKAEYLSHLRADNIVRDCEAVRRALGADRVSILGQSFGGFCCLTYLSFYPGSLREALITGGLAPKIGSPAAAEEAYKHTFRRVKTQNDKLYSRFPELGPWVRKVVGCLMANGGSVTTPAGNALTPRLLQAIGLSTLGSMGGFERLYYLFEGAFDEPGHLHPAFLKSVDSMLAFDSNVLYALLHEACYCDEGAQAPRWAAQRVRDSPEWRELFDAEAACKEGRPVMFTGEMVFPFFFEDIAGLRGSKDVAEAIAQWSDWGRLYDPDALAKNAIPCAATAYHEDMYVDYDLAMETARGVRGLRTWVTSEYTHGGIREDGARVFDRLLSMARDEVPLF